MISHWTAGLCLGCCGCCSIPPRQLSRPLTVVTTTVPDRSPNPTKFKPHEPAALLERRSSWAGRHAAPAINAKRRRGDITGRNTKYALYRFYPYWATIKPVDKTARVQRQFFERFYPTVISVRILAALAPLGVVCQWLYPAVIPARENRSPHEPTTLALAISL